MDVKWTDRYPDPQALRREVRAMADATVLKHGLAVAERTRDPA